MGFTDQTTASCLPRILHHQNLIWTIPPSVCASTLGLRGVFSKATLFLCFRSPQIAKRNWVFQGSLLAWSWFYLDYCIYNIPYDMSHFNLASSKVYKLMDPPLTQNSIFKRLSRGLIPQHVMPWLRSLSSTNYKYLKKKKQNLHFDTTIQQNHTEYFKRKFS